MKKITFNDLNSPETMRNPIMFYKNLIEQQECFFHIDDFYGMGGAWVVLDYDDVVAILKDPRFLKDLRKFTPPHDKQKFIEENTPVSKLFEWIMNMPNMLTVDPPDHTRLRRLVSKSFTPRMIEDLRPRIQQISDELLAAVQEQGKMEIIADFAYPLPIIVISEMLGIPAADRNQFREWTQELMNASVDPSQGTAVTATLEKFIHYIEVLLNEKRLNPDDDLISALVQSKEQEDKLSKNELLSTIWLLIIAGHETTVNLISNGVLALLQHPEQMNLLRQDPSLLPSAVDELLRYAGPIMFSSRFAGEDMTIHGKRIRKGELVLLSLTAANIDPKKFPYPETLNISREENNHLAFGTGIHHCLGAPLARLEGQIALGTLLQQLPNLRLAIEPDQLIYNYSKIRSLANLPVVF
ncbi:cytochrome P450 family protein [Bacillus pseudomycoides]|uniref:Cytochrome P450 n=1 Tax=Bacillus pseudomycoides TaxID=64104 RepID=A0A2C3XCJ7_9BACI|nr:cytochrome P450 [Bacillus pseudomycoides]PDY45136.1 cytochrome P450 [Bacillus pseudomycoides]PEA82921.1 cytochrome P450 [Bacillus pseudomycoides]PED04991.1 cytochrome P450 [Bacillus pseudomycoides]PED70417.1 cytochrome P450 [Bacillus pseudomycoides]PEI40048.1 cytochrome P450 [Bacillus pseudomycoides]